MRTKALLITAAIGAGVASAAAQDAVFSVNAVGYVNTNLEAGFNLISNPLNNGNNTLNEVIPSADDFINVQIWNGAGFDAHVYNPFGGGWGASGDVEVAPGGGFFIEKPATIDQLTFVGEVPQGDLVNPIPTGLSVASSVVPQSGALQGDLGLNLEAFTSLQLWDAAAQTFAVAVFGFDGTLAPDPVVGVGQAFFVESFSDQSWDRTFNVNE